MRALKLNVEDRRVDETWRWKIILLSTFIAGTMAIFFTVLALDGKMTPEERALAIQQSGFYP